jgi:hypothetical protein
VIFINKEYNMSRPKLPKEEKKIKLSITLTNEINLKLENLTNNKSKFIEDLIKNII